MIPIGKKQKPLLEYIVKTLKYNGVKDIVLLVGYKQEQIVNYFEDGSRFGVRIEYVIDDPNLKGTGGALLNAYLKGVFREYDTLLVYYGDILSNVDIRDLLQQHKYTRADATIAVATKYQVPVGVVEADEKGKIIKLVEKPWLNIMATIGILALEKHTLKRLEELSLKKKSLDIMGDLIPKLLEEGRVLKVYKHLGEWYDVGTTERYEKLDNKQIEEMFKEIFENS